jgi:hypothetical protein
MISRTKIGIEAARTDLLELEDRGLLEKTKLGKRYVFFSADGLEARLRQIGEAA